MKEIEFLPKNIEAEMLVDCPVPARKQTPSWFANTPAFIGGKFELTDSGPNSTVKLCTPLSDAFSMGYIQCTWSDIYITQDENGVPQITYPGGIDILDVRDKASKFHGPDYYPQEFIWHAQWIPKVPKGYSILYTHPLNREDLPFYTYSGVVDSDDYYYENGANHPVMIKSGFTGLIPRGTPMFQMIPFKRENWKSKKLSLDPYHELKANKPRQQFWGGYKDMFWKKKTYL